MNTELGQNQWPLSMTEGNWLMLLGRLLKETIQTFDIGIAIHVLGHGNGFSGGKCLVKMPHCFFHTCCCGLTLSLLVEKLYVRECEFLFQSSVCNLILQYQTFVETLGVWRELQSRG